MSSFGSKYGIFLLLVAFGVLVQACAPKCEDRDYMLNVKFVDGGAVVRKHFDRVYDPSLSTNWIENDFLDSIPVDLSRDTTYFILESEDAVDTLMFSYKRSLKASSHEHAYCMTLSNPGVREETTWAWVFINFQPSYWGPSQGNPYEIEISL